MLDKSDIENIFKLELDHLKDGVKNSKNLYHTFTLSTLDKESPKSRTVVLRNVETAPLKIFFNADYRSPKIKQMINNPQCSALFYDINFGQSSLWYVANIFLTFNDFMFCLFKAKLWLPHLRMSESIRGDSPRVCCSDLLAVCSIGGQDIHGKLSFMVVCV